MRLETVQALPICPVNATPFKVVGARPNKTDGISFRSSDYSHVTSSKSLGFLDHLPLLTITLTQLISTLICFCDTPLPRSIADFICERSLCLSHPLSIGLLCQLTVSEYPFHVGRTRLPRRGSGRGERPAQEAVPRRVAEAWKRLRGINVNQW